MQRNSAKHDFGSKKTIAKRCGGDDPARTSCQPAQRLSHYQQEADPSWPVRHRQTHLLVPCEDCCAHRRKKGAAKGSQDEAEEDLPELGLRQDGGQLQRPVWPAELSEGVLMHALAPLEDAAPLVRLSDTPQRALLGWQLC